MELNLPDRIPVSDLEATHPSYDGAYVADCDALYRGGRAFRARKDRFIIRRKIEEGKSDSPFSGGEQYRERTKRMHYVNRAGGLIDWLVAAVTRAATPRIVVEGGTDEQRAYWLGLNDDADGLGTPLPALVRQSLRAGMAQERSYYRVHADAPEARPSDPASMAARMRLLDPVQVDDWDVDGDSLSWTREHGVEAVRPAGKPYGKAELERHVWIFRDAASIAVYEAWKKGQRWCDAAGTPLPSGAEPSAVRNPALSCLRHEFGGLPVFEVRAPACNWVMDRIYDVVVALLNADLDISHALHQQAYAQPVLTLTNPERVNSIVATELAALVLEQAEKFEYVAPNPGIFEPLYKNVERLKSALHEVVQTMAKEAAAIPQAGRMSGAAVDAMRDPLHALLASFCWPDREAIERWIRAVQRFRREEDLTVRLEGLDAFDANATMAALQADLTDPSPAPEAAPTEPTPDPEETRNGE